MNVEEILMKIAKGIETKGCGGCPCHKGCDVNSDEACLDRIVAWLKEMTETEPLKIIRCEFCNHKFEPLEHFVVGYEDDGEEVFMCETCFFDLALNKLNCKGVQMYWNGIDYHDLSDDDSEEEWDE